MVLQRANEKCHHGQLLVSIVNSTIDGQLDETYNGALGEGRWWLLEIIHEPIQSAEWPDNSTVEKVVKQVEEQEKLLE